MQIFHATGTARPDAPTRADRPSQRRASSAPPPVRQPPLAPPGVDAAPGMLAPVSAPVPAAPLLGVPDGAVAGALDMLPDDVWSELVLSDFFWHPAPAAMPAIRTPAKTARHT
ncbi:hypothetical protein C6P95_06090 [Burkholderia multivorans]|uniref:hypothetical protein n=1 Tax=Burkholderia multivorans TaxID=87883 RepID=UPI000CFFD58F|nr:hypothetical protein [Burkholderia multivorans]PRE69606.1 hypothetical protein C6P95_06090 [Burkholderia multivorans]